MAPVAVELRPYQRDMLDAIMAAHNRGKGQNRLLIRSPTGSGKTISFAALPKWPGLQPWLTQWAPRDRKMMIIAHREELLDQSAAKILQQNPDLSVSIEQADRYASRFSDVVVASIQTLAATKFRRLKRLLAHSTYRVVIVDECHHSSSDTYRTALTHLGFLPPADASDVENDEAPSYTDIEAMQSALTGWDEIAPKDRLLVGVTATPNRSDAIGLGCVFQTIAYSYELKQAIQDKWLVPIVPWVVETRENLDDVKIARGDFNQRQLSDAVNTTERNQIAVAAWKERAEGRPTIVFTVTVDHAHALAAEFRRQGVLAEALHGETPKDERRSVLSRYTRRELTVICNAMILTEGTDLPLTSCILNAKPTKSATLYTQLVGRGLRIHPEKHDCILIDVVDIARKHSLQTAPVLYGLPPGLNAKGETLDKLAAGIEDLLEQHPGFDVAGAGRLTLEQLRAKMSTFDIWSVRPMGEAGAGLTLNWIRTGDDSYRMQYPVTGEIDEIMTVEKDLLGKFEIKLTQRAKTGAAFGPGAATAEPPRVLTTGLLEAKAGLRLGEEYVKSYRSSVLRLVDRDAPWRRRPASSGQLRLLNAWRIPHNAKTLTSGAASDLIEVAKARRGGR